MKNTTRSHAATAAALTALALAALAPAARAQSTPMADPSATSSSSTIPSSSLNASSNSSSSSMMLAQASATGTGSGWTGTGDAYSLLPFTRHGYVGINVGRSKLDSPCGTGGYACDDPNATLSVYTGGLLTDWVGAELGYFRTTNADRSGGKTRLQGVDVVAVLRAPIGAFNAYVKGGGVYGESRVSTGALSDVTPGKKRGWGPTYSVGVGYDFLPNSGVVLDWTRHEVKFPAGGDREKVDTTSVGYVFRF